MSYRFLPNLTPQQFSELKASIAEIGVQVPIVVDQQGNIIDGYHREQACDELGIECPRLVREFVSETQKYELILALNCQRRHLVRRQKRQLVADYLKLDPEIANNSLAEIIGISKNTVAAIRKQLEATCQIAKLESLRGKDGKRRPQKYRRILANNSKEATLAHSVFSDLPPSCGGKTLDVVTAARRVRRAASKSDISEPAHCKLADDSVQIIHARFQDLTVDPASVSLILTDIPYGKEFLPELDDLGAFAERVLVEGGLFVSYVGQYHLNQYFTAFGQHLNYRWTLASVWQGDGNVVHPYQIISQWKPILIFSKGGWAKRGLWPDTFLENSKEKHWHSWQQPFDQVQRLVRYFSRPGDLVVDPCGGGGTTALACHQLGNRRCISCDSDLDAVHAGRQRLAAVTRSVDPATTANESNAGGISISESRRIG